MKALLLAIKDFFSPNVSTGIRATHYALLCVVLCAFLLVQDGPMIARVAGLGPASGANVARTPASLPIGNHIYWPPERDPPPPVEARIAGTLRVQNVRTLDTGVDITSTVNQWAGVEGIDPVGVVAVAGVESAIRQYAPHYPIAGAGGCDYSFGLMQITVCTIAGLGVGDGTLSQYNIDLVHQTEDNPVTSAKLGTIFLGQIHRLVCWGFPYLYAAYNEGPGYGCYSTEYEYPSNYFTQQALASFRSWYNYAYWHYATTAPIPRPTPKPKPSRPFNYGLWCRWSRTHAKPCPSPSIPHHRYQLTWPASIFYRHGTVGSFQSAAWYGRTRTRHHGFDVYRYSHGTAWAWPGFHRATVHIFR